MATTHPSIQELASFLQGVPTAQHRVVRHLLTGCTYCRNTLQRVRESLASGASSEGSAPSTKHRSYDEMLTRAQQGIALFLTGSGRPTDEPPDILLNEIAIRSFEAEFPAGPASPHLPLFIKWLILRSEALRFRSSEQMLHFALLARFAADACAAAEAGSEVRLADLRARAWGQLSNALRINGRLPAAEAALYTAEQYSAAGTGDPLAQARLLQKAGGLLTYQHRLDDAFVRLDQAELLFDETGLPNDLAGNHIQKSIAFIHAGDPELAIEYLDRAMPLIDTKEDPLLLIAARHNYARCAIDLGRPDQAIALAGELPPLDSFPLLRLRLQWNHGKLLRLLGRTKAAVTTLAAVQRGFINHGLRYETAALGLEMEPMLREIGRSDEADSVLGRAKAILSDLRVRPESVV